MASYIDPSPDDFRTKFPEFDEDYLDDDSIQALLDEAKRSVDKTWIAGDYTNAILYRAAHILQAGPAHDGGEGSAAITSEHIGQISVTYAQRAFSTQLESTVYGQEFVRLRKLNFPAIVSI